MVPKSHPWEGVEVGGRYRVGGKLGRGNAGWLFGEPLQPGDAPAALVLLSEESQPIPSLRERLHEVGARVARLRHPHTVPLVDLNEGSPSYVAFEYLVGESLAQHWAKGPNPVDEVRRLGAQIAGSLAEAHGFNLVHHDLKPSKVLVVLEDDQPSAKVLDYGVAQRLIRAPEDEAGMVVGSPRYLAPEQLAPGPTEPASNCYSLGVMLFEALAGRAPFERLTVEDYQRAHASASPLRLAVLCPDLPPVVSDIIDRCLAKDPKDRPMAYQIQRALAGRSGWAGLVWREASENRRLRLVLGFALVVAAIAVWAAF